MNQIGVLLFTTLLIASLAISSVESKRTSIPAVIMVSLVVFRADTAHGLTVTDCAIGTVSNSNANQNKSIRTCVNDTDCCNGDQCVSRICVDTENIVVTVIKSVSKPLNNIYAIFSLWDEKCNPYAVSSQSLNAVLRIEERKTVGGIFSPISNDESWYGLAENAVPTVARALLVLDVSNSVQKNNGIVAIKTAVTSFLTSLRGSGDKVEVAMFGFGGTTASAKDQILFPISVNTTAFSSNYDELQTAITEATFACNEKIDCTTTDLYGAVIFGLQKFATDEKRITYDFMLVFSDGSDQAGLHTIEEVVSSTEISSVTVYGVTIPGEGNSLTIWNQIASGGVYDAKDLNSLKTKFQEIATIISAFSRTIYVITYCTPSRQGSPTVKVILNVSKQSQPTFQFSVDSKIFEASGARVCSEENADFAMDLGNIGNAVSELVGSEDTGGCFYSRRGSRSRSASYTTTVTTIATTPSQPTTQAEALTISGSQVSVTPGSSTTKSSSSTKKANFYLISLFILPFMVATSLNSHHLVGQTFKSFSIHLLI